MTMTVLVVMTEVKSLMILMVATYQATTVHTAVMSYLMNLLFVNGALTLHTLNLLLSLNNQFMAIVAKSVTTNRLIPKRVDQVNQNQGHHRSTTMGIRIRRNLGDLEDQKLQSLSSHLMKMTIFLVEHVGNTAAWEETWMHQNLMIMITMMT